MKEKKTLSKSRILSMLISILVIVLITAGSFLLFGGEHYLANKADIDYKFFHHLEDSADPVNWVTYLLETGQLAGILVFVVSVLTALFFNRQQKS